MKRDWMIKESELDEDQIMVLMATLDKSCIVSGCAGSGKSVLALIKAQRIQKERGNNYKIIVFTKALCQYMNSGREELGLVNDFYYHMEWKYKRERRGHYMVYSRDENGRKIPYMPHADYIIVDEIQDFDEDEIQEFIDATDKQFFFFGDTAQSIYEGLKDTMNVEDISDLLPRGDKPKPFSLYRNYRLPINVAKLAQQVGVDLPRFNPLTYKSKENAMPHIIRYDSLDNQLNAISRIIRDRELTDVAILLPDNEMVKDVWRKLNEDGIDCELRYNDKENFKNSQDTLDFSTTNPKVMTYHSAKGLQFDSVFLPALEDFEDDEDDHSHRKALYVAMTRTYRNLFMMYSGRTEDPLYEIINYHTDLFVDSEKEQVDDM